MATFAYPTLREIREIGARKLARSVDNRLGFKLMPLRNVNAGILQWNQRDNYAGLQNLRGLDGAPFHVQNDGKTSFIAQPGVFGDFMTIGEEELTNRAGGVMGDAPIDLTDLLMERQDILIGREMDRMEQIIWTLISTGTFSVSSSTGVGVTFTDTYTLQTLDATDWGTPTTSTPIKDFRDVQAKSLGYSVNFGSAARAVMNRATANKLLTCSNAADMGGRRVLGGSTINNLAAVNQILLGEDLPQIEIYDEGYFATQTAAVAADSSANFTKFIANDVVVVVGARTNGEPIGEYRLTRNAANPNMAPGSYEVIKDFTGNAPDGTRHIPPRLEVHRGHNGGPVIYFPSAICVMAVGA